MSIKFGKNGDLYCNTVRYNYKQARNLIADNCGDQISNIYTLSNASLVTNEGYRTYRSFKFNSGTNMLSMVSQSPMPTPIAGHKYYGGLYWKTTGSSFSATDNRFEWYTTDSANGTMVFANKNVATNGNWVKLSSIQTLNTVASGTWILRNFLVNASTVSYCSKMMIIDLTDTFGSGNEPTKEWCDNNILEWDKFVNFGTNSGTINKTNYNTKFTASDMGFQTFNYLSLDSNWEPRDYMYLLVSNANVAEGLLTCTQNFSIEQNEFYYAFYESERDDTYLRSSGHNGDTSQFYIPIAEPSMGSCPLVNNILFNGGGGMSRWKRFGLMAERANWSTGSYPFRIDFDNRNNVSSLRMTNITLSKIKDTLKQYNNYYGTLLTSGDSVNKAWCDRWIAGRSTPIIHIKDHNNKTIEFNKPIQEIIQEDTYKRKTKSELDRLCGLDSVLFTYVTNTSKLKTQEYAYISFIVSDTNTPVRFLVYIKSFSANTVTAIAYSYGASGSDIYELCNGYDIVCNDIEIRPDIERIEFDKTGTIRCHSLVKTQQY